MEKEVKRDVYKRQLPHSFRFAKLLQWYPQAGRSLQLLKFSIGIPFAKSK